MQLYIPEILKEINKNPLTIGQYTNYAPLRFLFEYAFDPDKKFILPEGTPPYKPDTSPMGMSPAVFAQECKKLYIYCRADLLPIRRESIFIQLLENIHPSEAEVLLLVKEQTISKVYKKITHKLVYDAGFPVPPPLEKAPKKSKKGVDGTAP